MNLERYNYQVARTYKKYHFYSKGPKGHIHKVVCFDKIYTDSGPIYNLTFGDWEELTKEINDEIVSNNGDMEMVLATVAAIVADFTDRFENTKIIAMGSSKSRTRLYQMTINKYWDEIEEIFYVYGVREGHLFPFQKNIGYDAFLVSRKEVINLWEQAASYMKANPNKNLEKQPVVELEDRKVVDMPDFSNCPYVIKKAEAAKKLLDNCVFPEGFWENKGWKK